MASTKISALPAGTAAATDEIPANQGGTTKKLTALDISALRVIANDEVTNAKLANMVQSTIKGRAAAAGTGDPTDLTAAQVRTLIEFAANISGVGSRVKGLTGINNSGTPDTQYDLSADEVILVNPSDGTSVARFATGVITNNLATAGSAANGRDQAGAFSASSWIHLWFIWSGTTLATLSSASATAPTLPSGYTHQAYCGAVRYNATPLLLPTRILGSRAILNVADGGETRVLNGGASLSFAAVDCSSYIPPNSRTGLFFLTVFGNNGGGPAQFYCLLRPTGSTEAGQIGSYVTTQGSGIFSAAMAWCVSAVSSAQSIDYLLSASGGGVTIDVRGYIVPNGGE